MISGQPVSKQRRRGHARISRRAACESTGPPAHLVAQSCLAGPRRLFGQRSGRRFITATQVDITLRDFIACDASPHTPRGNREKEHRDLNCSINCRFITRAARFMGESRSLLAREIQRRRRGRSLWLVARRMALIRATVRGSER